MPHQSTGEPARAKPELVDTRPGQVWPWDITKLRGLQRGVYYDLHVVIDHLLPIRRGLDHRRS